MKKLLNTLYVTTQGAYLAREGETVQVRVEKETRLQLPIHTLAGIVCFGQFSCSSFLETGYPAGIRQRYKIAPRAGAWIETQV
jgi:hypothetical protein